MTWLFARTTGGLSVHIETTASHVSEGAGECEVWRRPRGLDFVTDNGVAGWCKLTAVRTRGGDVRGNGIDRYVDNLVPSGQLASAGGRRAKCNVGEPRLEDNSWRYSYTILFGWFGSGFIRSARFSRTALQSF